MPLAVQICLIVVSIAVVWLAVMAIRALSHTIILIENANRSLAELPGLIEDAKRMSARTEALVLSCSQITQSARGGVLQFERLATRTGDLASALLDEAAGPITKAVGVIRIIRSGANIFMQRWRSRSGNRSQTRPADDLAAEQGWLDDGGGSRASYASRNASRNASP